MLTRKGVSDMKINEDGEGSTMSGDIAINPGAGGAGNITMRMDPDEELNGIAVFITDAHNFSQGSSAKLMRQRYNFTDPRIIGYLKSTNWTRPFYLKHNGNMTKVAKVG